MEELRLLAKKYYEDTVRLSFFGMKGWIYLIASSPLIILTFYFIIQSNSEPDWEIYLFAFFIAMLWSEAQKHYERNLIRYLSYYTHHQSNNLHEHKAIYLQILTSHVKPTLYETMKAFKEIRQTDSQKILGIGWLHFFKFLYDPESKNRILSLLIYLISLIALLTIIKPNNDVDIFALIAEISFDEIKNYFLLAIFFVLLGYLVCFIPIMFIVTYVIVPLLLRFSSASLLSHHFISQLNRYAFTAR
jgi:hypothetical protein